MGDIWKLDRMIIAGTEYGGMADSSVSRNLQTSLEYDSYYHPSAKTITRSEPVLTFTSYSVLSLLTAMYSSSRVIPHIPLVGVSADLVFAKVDADSGLLASGSVHQARRVTAGVIVPVRLSSRGGALALECALHVIFDGTNQPIQSLAAQALQAGSPAPAALHAIQGVQISGSTLAGIDRDVSVDFGITVDTQGNTAVYPQAIDVGRFAPTASFSSGDAAAILTACGTTGQEISVGGAALVFGQLSPTGVGFTGSGGFSLTFRGAVTGPASKWWWDNIEVTENQCRAACQIVGLGGDSNVVGSQPLAFATGVSYLDYLAGEIYRAGVARDKSAVVEYERVTVSSGLSMRRSGGAHRHWPTHLDLERAQPRISLRTTDLAYLQGLADDEGARAIDTGYDVFMRHMQTSSVAYGIAEAEHVKLLLSGGQVELGDESGDMSDLAGGDVTVHGFDPDGYAMLSVDTASTMPS